MVTATWASDTHRAGELTEALAILGAGKPQLLGFADHRIPDSAPGRPRLRDAPMEEVVQRIVEHIRSVRPTVVVTHDAYGQLTGHPDHIRTHQATVLAVHAAGLEHRFPDTGPPWRPQALYAATHPHSGVGLLSTLMERVGKTVLSVPDEHITASVDVSPWLDQKERAILAHRSEAAKERPLPGVLARLPAAARESVIRTEYFTRLSAGPTPGALSALTV